MHTLSLGTMRIAVKHWMAAAMTASEESSNAHLRRNRTPASRRTDTILSSRCSWNTPSWAWKEFRMEDTKQVSLAVNESIYHMRSSLIYKLKDCWGLQPWKWCTFFPENLARLKIGRHYTICRTTWKKLVAPVILVEISLRKLTHFTMPLVVCFPAKWPLWNNCRNSILMTCHYPDLGRASDWLCLEANLLKQLRTGISALTR